MEEPIVWPSVTVDGLPIEIRYDMGVMYQASQRGICVGDIADRGRNFATVMDMLAILAEPVLKAAKRDVLTGAQWALKLKDLDQFVEIARAFNEAYLLSAKQKPVESSPAPPASEATGLPN